jgi:hypothetical protein
MLRGADEYLRGKIPADAGSQDRVTALLARPG